MSEPNHTASLHLAHQNLLHLLGSIHKTPLSRFRFVAPIIDRNNPDGWRQEDLQGFKKFMEGLECLRVFLDGMIESGIPPRDDPLPNVMGLITFWKTLLLARGPIPAIKTGFKGKGKEECFVDVVARGGEEWIRIYSKKVSQLLSEFREQDSYLNSDFDSSSDEEEGTGVENGERNGAGPSKRNGKEKGLQNSIIATVDTLLSIAAQVERIPGSALPRITLRLTRISEDANEDERIQQTFQVVRKKGVNLVFGDLSDIELDDIPSARPRVKLKASRKINLDPTSLMGLCSDLLHHPLPITEEEARTRFFRPEDNLTPGIGQSQNSRELVKNLFEEMEMPLIEEIRDTIASGYEEVEFWATKEAVRYLKEALGSEEVVGDGMEQRRMRRLIGEEGGDFFEGSRYEGKEGVLEGLKLKIFNDDINDSKREAMCREGMRSFQSSLSAISRQFLDEYQSFVSNPTKSAQASLPNFLKPQRLPIPKVAQLSLPFPIVSLISLQRGAAEGMTTLMMGNIVMREMFSQPRWKVKGWVQGSMELEDLELDGEGELADRAAVWMLPYRTLGEGKRVKFEKGDWSYPRTK